MRRANPIPREDRSNHSKKVEAKAKPKTTKKKKKVVKE